MPLAHVHLRYPLRWQTPPGEVFPPDTLRAAQHALTVPWMAVVHAPWVSWEGDVAWGYVLRPEDVPDGHLPVPGVTLYL